ncbi:MAG TPA: ribonuclease J, partial [Alphaproteobacteria bacterium]|nr:ribonuclease J [Alphaproteobacteria bacterium]
MSKADKKVGYKDFAKGLYFIPLGGSEQFGVNFNLYCCDGKWLIMDCGIGFADETFPNVDILLPDPEFIEPVREDIVGMVITHAHEDHVGAVPYLWPRLKCPIYCSKFTAAVLRAKFHDFPNCKDAVIYEVDTEQDLKLEPFSLKFVHVAHSIPQAVLTRIKTPYGNLVHTGDWNLDPAPVIDTPTDEATLKHIGDEGVLAYIGDSTNAPIPGRAGSETEVEEGLLKVFQGLEGKRILITMFASNVARIQTICRTAQATGRSVCMLGRSLHRMTANAHECGYLDELQGFVSEGDIDSIPGGQLVIIATGSQGEARAALARIARGDWKGVKLGRGDVAIFSSKAIPGNEKDINKVKNNLSASGVRVIDASNAGARIHVSGHPYRDEIRDMYGFLRPQCVIPVHGEHVMLVAQAGLAHECGIKQVIIPNNGSVIRLDGEPEMIDHVPTGVLAVEPQRVIKGDHAAIHERRKLQYSGA